MTEPAHSKKRVRAIFLVVCMSAVGTLLLFSGFTKRYSYYPKIKGYHLRKPVFAIGILSSADFSDRRNTARRTWLSLIQHTPFDIKYKFLLDRPTDSSEKENEIYGDIIYLNVSTSQYAVEFAEKLKSWFKYALEAYPEAGLIAKVDDDVYPCVRIFTRIHEIMTNDLYYGFKHNYEQRNLTTDTRIDEMFVVVGREVVKKFVTAKICGNKFYSKRACSYGDCALAEWIWKKNVTVNWRNDNSKMVHFDRYTGLKYRMVLLELTRRDYCEDNFLFHKSSQSLMYKFGYLDRKRLNIDAEKLIAIEFKVSKVTKADKIPSCKIWCVAMANQKPSPIILRIATLKSWCLVIVGDQYSPDKIKYMEKFSDFRPDFVYFLSPADHERLFPELSEVLPWNHFSRMNIGFMFAIKHMAKFIYGIDLIMEKKPFTMYFILKRDKDYLNRTANISDSNIYKMATASKDTNDGIRITKSPQFDKPSQNDNTTYGPLYMELCPSDFDEINKNRSFVDSHESVNLRKSWASDVDDFNLPSHNFCFSYSKVPVGSLKFIPYKQCHRVNCSFDNNFVPFVSKHDVVKVQFETFWLPSLFNHIALPISNSIVLSRAIHQLVINHALRQNNLRTMYIPVPWKKTNNTFLNQTQLQNRTQHGLEFDTIPLSLQNENDLESVFQTLFVNRFISYDNIGLSRAWSSTIDSIHRSHGTEKDKET